MIHDYSENVLIQGSAANLLRDELGWETVYAYNTEQLGGTGTLGRKSCKEILLTWYCGLCQRYSAAVCGAESRRGGRAGRLYQQLHRLPGHHPPPVLL